jgi:hypothetical protein
MRNKLCIKGSLAKASGYNPFTCAWFEHAINGQVRSVTSAFLQLPSSTQFEAIALKSQSSIDSDRCARLVQPGAMYPQTALAAVTLDGAYAAVPVLFYRARMCLPRSMAACGVWSGCRGQVAPDVKTNRAFAARYAVPVDTRVVRIIER